MSTNVVWHEGLITREARAKLLGQKGATVWLSGLSGSGKSTVSVELEQQLFAKKVLSYRLDGDNIRQGLNKNLSFSPADRKENIRRISEVAKLMCDIGVVVTTAFISPYTEDRDMAREIHKAASIPFIEVFVDCPLEVAESRDPKGLYKKARSGEIKNFTGIDAPYEKPPSPEITLDTSKQTIAECAAVILTYLTEKGLISSEPKEEAKPAKELEVAPAAPAAEAEAEKVPAAV
uniref:Adenylyl-sulfate kinase n=1 Tax=Porphyra purpurea TaxID=2787 RepID=Q7XBB6_PORPU|nr:adenosine 5'-phosphosulfate kinase [Porphyra purpurea]